MFFKLTVATALLAASFFVSAFDSSCNAVAASLKTSCHGPFRAIMRRRGSDRLALGEVIYDGKKMYRLAHGTWTEPSADC